MAQKTIKRADLAEESVSVSSPELPEKIEAVLDVVAKASQARGQEPAPFGEGPKRRWRVSLKDCRVLVRDPVKDVSIRQDFLEVEAASEAEAIALFAKHNGIPMVMDQETKSARLASVHNPVVRPLAP